MQHYEKSFIKTKFAINAIYQSTIETKTIFNLAEGYLVACFDADRDDDVIILNRNMQYYVSSMADYSDDTNFEQIFKTYSPSKTVKIL